MKQNQLTIRYDDINLLVRGAKEITLNPQGEEILVKLLDLKELVEKALTQAKETLSVAMSEIDPDLTSVSSDRIKIMNRSYGAKYKLDDNLIENIDQRFYQEKKSYFPVAVEIDKAIKETGNLPMGINFNERNKTVSISKKDNLEIE